MADMELTVLGSGAFAPERGASVRNPSGYAVRLGRRVLLFDLGFGNVRQLARAGLDPALTTDVFLSHRHPDHIGDLAALLFLFRYDVRPRAGRLRVWGPKGLKRFWGDLKKAYEPWLTPRGYRLELRELEGGERAAGPGWRVETLSVPHPTPALAYRLTAGGKSLVYSGDTGFTLRLAAFAGDCDLFLLECSVPQRRAMPGHLTPKQALRIADASGCRRVLLTHVSAASAAEARRLLKPGGKVRIACDLMRLRIL